MTSDNDLKKIHLTVSQDFDREFHLRELFTDVTKNNITIFHLLEHIFPREIYLDLLNKFEAMANDKFMAYCCNDLSKMNEIVSNVKELCNETKNVIFSKGNINMVVENVPSVVCNSFETDKINFIIDKQEYTFKGQFQNKEPFFGELVSKNEKYIGFIKNFMKDGQGTLIYNTSRKFIGLFQQGSKHYGQDFMANGNTFIGHYKNGRIHQGKYTFNNNTIFEGLFNNSYLIEGKIIYPNGDRFEGKCVEDIPSIGKFRFTNGSIFEGEVSPILNVKGKWKMKCPNNIIYQGFCNDNIMDLKIIHCNGIVYYEYFDGYCKVDQIEKLSKTMAIGKIKYSDICQYEGEMKNMQKWGHGKIVYDNGKAIEGKWKNDLLISVNEGEIESCFHIFMILKKIELLKNNKKHLIQIRDKKFIETILFSNSKDFNQNVADFLLHFNATIFEKKYKYDKLLHLKPYNKQNHKVFFNQRKK